MLDGVFYIEKQHLKVWNYFITKQLTDNFFAGVSRTVELIIIKKKVPVYRRGDPFPFFLKCP